MRDIVVLAIIFVSAPIALVRPFYGILVWTWIAYFNPHRYTWGVAYNFPVSLVIAVPTLIGTVFSRRKNKHLFVRETTMLCLLWIWFLITTIYVGYVPAFARHVSDTRFQFGEISKILLMTIVTIWVVDTREKLRTLLWIVLLSFGIRTLFGALFGIETGGQFKVFGPEDSFIADNNDFALALNMALPIFFFLAQGEKARWLRVALRTMMGSSILCIILSYSRGGLLGLTTAISSIALRSKRKLISVVLACTGVLLLLSFSPPAWRDRMSKFLHGEVDESAENRLTIWKAGWNLVQDYPITGAGFAAFPDGSLLVRYTPGATLESVFQAPHSIYFQMLGEQGFVGLGLFVLLLGCAYVSTRSLRKLAKLHPDLEWIRPYTFMFEGSLLAYLVNGATLGRAYFDIMYLVIACIIILKILAMRDLRRLQGKATLHDSDVPTDDALAGIWNGSDTVPVGTGLVWSKYVDEQ